MPITPSYFEVGQKVEARKMASDSFYKAVRGTVTEVRNGYVLIDATEVIDRWSKTWERHPSSCATSAQIEHVVSI